MESDAQIRDDVISELAWDPQLPDAEGIGVNVSDGAVTMAGSTSSYAAKLAAARGRRTRPRREGRGRRPGGPPGSRPAG